MRNVRLIVNGFPRDLAVNPHEMLLDTLRERVGLTGTKKGCEQGSCGSCTVILEGTPVLACLTPTLRCADKHILTIEGLEHETRDIGVSETGAVSDSLHPVQRQMVEKGAIQCGYCTPGIVMTAVAFLKNVPDPSETEIREALSGNLCRCTGYAKIVQAVRAAAEELSR